MSEVKVNKVTPRSGTTLTIGDSGDPTNVVGTLQNNGAALVGDISSVVAGTNLSGGGTSGAVTINLADASTSAKGASSFSSDNFAASSGAITIKDLGVATAELQDDCVTTDKLANSINTAITANTNKVTNATHSGEVTGSGALTIAGNVVDEANLKISNNPTNGYFLTAQSGGSGGMTWAAPPGGGKVLQVLNDTATSAVATTAGTGTFVDTGLSQAITPSASSSKILCIGSIFHIRKNGDTSVNFRLIRGSTTIITPMGNYDTGDGQQLTEVFNFQFLDTPSTTNATTYKISFSSGNANLGMDTCPAQFTLMEIGA